MNVFTAILYVSAVCMVVHGAPELVARRKLPALQHEEVHDTHGQYALRYVTAEGSVVSERGRLVPSSNGNLVLVYEGEYTFRGDDGKTYVTKYHADQTGFHVDANHLPKTPVTP
ncbi:Endocuticle structural glycoprotein SgAbd-2 [Eumeta japonica]|uniref:Endocuticle structural glycoprotein SgAbd-2 n=1 Tax=Eumeta variegata TaxID=151549 RepID=A0A4C1VZD8_EUMVA|nr:Endocuticle structural glycoprotein SgAbd-2 [Eumeta japonica]